MSLFGPVLSSCSATSCPFVFVLTVVVFFHELGHFLVGRWCGVRVDVFSHRLRAGIVRPDRPARDALALGRRSARRLRQVPRRHSMPPARGPSDATAAMPAGRAGRDLHGPARLRSAPPSWRPGRSPISSWPSSSCPASSTSRAGRSCCRASRQWWPDSAAARAGFAAGDVVRLDRWPADRQLHRHAEDRQRLERRAADLRGRARRQDLSL